MLSPADAALVERDRELPGLATLLDPAAFAGRLRAALPSTAVGVPEPRYVRYKPGTSCLVAYRVDLDSRRTHVYAKTYGTAASAKLGKRLGRGRVVFDDVNVVVFLFPHDHELRPLARLTNDDTRAAFLQALLPSRPQLWRAAASELRYKPERRYVARLSAETGARAVVRLYGSEDWPRASAAAHTIGSGRLLRVPPLLGRSRRHHMLVLGWLSGRPLPEALADPEFDPSAVSKVGEALAVLHAQEAGRLVAAGPYAPSASLAAAARAVEAVCPDLGERAARLARRLTAGLVEPPRPAAAIHGDFSSDQVLLAGKEVGILDLDAARPGDPASDLGTFVAQLEREVLRGALDPERAAAAGAALVEGWRAHTEGRVGAIELHTAAALLRLAVEPFRLREPDWPAQALAILERAEKLAVRSAPRPRRAASKRHPLASLAALDDLELRRAWPREAGHLLLEYTGSEGHVLGAQWLDDPARLERIARSTARRGGSVALLDAPNGRVLVQRDGADRRLRSLAPLLTQPGATLVTHRPERRAVARLADNSSIRYAKVVRPERTAELAATGRAAHALTGQSFAAPELLHADIGAGVLLWAGLPGVSPHDLAGTERLVPGAHAAGVALRALHASPLPADARCHTAEEEVRWVRVWLERLEAFAPALHRRMAAAYPRIASALSATPAPRVLLHRDFFDKQVVIDADGRPGLLDFDTLAAGEAAVDVANMLVHLELRALQGLCPPARAGEAAAAFANGYRPNDGVRRRLDVYADATRLRLAALYAFRPRWAQVPKLLLERLGHPVVWGAARE